MHEASAAEAIVKMVGEAAASRVADGRVPRVARIRVAAGESLGYMEESLAFYLRVLGKGTPAEGAAVELRIIKARFRCGRCGAEFERQRFSFDCPDCGGPGVLVSDGSGLFLDSIELEE